MNRLTLITALAAFVALGCQPAVEGPFPVESREDLKVVAYRAYIDDGLSSTITFEVPEGAESFLIEVQGNRGLYSLIELTTPSGRQLIEDAGFTTRSSRGNYGLANWMYPNGTGGEVESGSYRMVIRAMETPEGGKVTETVDIRIYQKLRSGDDECGIMVDFLIDDSALALADIEEALERITMETDRLMSQAGIRVLNYSLVRVNLANLDVDVSEDSVLPVVDDVLSQARLQGYAREGAIHVLLVRSIGGTAEPKGRALGLPGPFGNERPNSAVLVASDHFVDFDGYLNTDGLSETLTHEMGHYLGLYHTSEATRDKHDPIDDTAECTTNFCSDEFDVNIMATQSPRRRFELTDGQAQVMRNHPLCIPLSLTDFIPPPPPPTCDLECDAPLTCAIWNGVQMCLPACDPDSPDVEQCESFCTTSDDGVFICQPPPGGGSQ